MVSLEQYYGLVVYRARKIHSVLLAAGKEEIELEDLIQEGCVGLLEASQRYNPHRGAVFATFAMPRVEGAIKDYLRKLDPLTSRERQRVRELERTKDALIRALGRSPLTEELAQALKVSEEEVKKTEALAIFLLSLEDANQSETETGEQSVRNIPSPTPSPEEAMMTGRLAQDVDECLQLALDDLERQILIPRILGGLTLQSVGRLLNISTANVQRREVIAKRKMQHCLEEKGWEITDI